MISVNKQMSNGYKQMLKEAALMVGIYYKLEVQINENKSKFIDKLTSTHDMLNPLPTMQLKGKWR